MIKYVNICVEFLGVEWQDAKFCASEPVEGFKAWTMGL